MKRLLTLCLVLFAVVAARAATDDQIREALAQLDFALSNKTTYTSNRSNRIASLEDMLGSLSLEQQYIINNKIYDELFSFSFDRSLQCLESNLKIAQRLGDRTKVTDTKLEQAFLYTISGMYLEASEIFALIDTTRFSAAQELRYAEYMHRFNRDLNEYTKNNDMGQSSTHRLAYYRDRIYELAEPQSELFLSTRLLEYYDRHEYAKAADYARKLVDMFTADNHRYAIYTYYMGLIDQMSVNSGDQILWYARSATTDVQLAVKDNASLCSLASALFTRGELDAAFRYINHAIDDAFFYNAKLRPWQLVNLFPGIEQAYQEVIAERQKTSHVTTVVIMVLAIILLIICCCVVVLLYRMRRSRNELSAKSEAIGNYNQQLSSVNARLSELNHQITEANVVKEEYIGLFLSMCSDYIDKLMAYQRNVRKRLSAGQAVELQREVSSSTLMDNELSEFYEMFDNAFLRLYPNFVGEFNSLLSEDGRIEPPKGERLNTELRIFALIRLGINDSSKIAALLRYSVNTIYNYRAKIKGKAIIDRDNFEEVIKTIGSFNIDNQ